MNETVTNVYDLVYPSPVTLKEISSIVIAVDLWRKEIEKCCENNPPTLDEFLLDPQISLRSAIPNAPSVIYDLIKDRIAIFKFSIKQWMDCHSDDIFYFHYHSINDLIQDFHDFAYDWDGTIHYVRTAKRLLLCDRFNDEEKFIIACIYCFEEDIERIWPSVSANFDLNEIDFERFPHLYYWICRLTNQLLRIPNPYDESFDEIMLYKCQSNNWSSVEYFWNRMPLDKQLQTTRYFSIYNWGSFVRFILPKLNERQSDEFLTEETAGDMIFMLTYDATLIYLLPAWMHVRNIFDESNFNRVVEKMFHEETNCLVDIDNRAYVYQEFWKSAANNLKKSAIKDIMLLNNFFHRQLIKPSPPRKMSFLITVLQDADSEERKTFWHRNWRELIVDAKIEDFIEVMKLCLEDENEITRFMETTMVKYENISMYCIALLIRDYFKELNDFLVFCYPDTQKRKEFKQRLLQTNYIGENSVLHRGFFCVAEQMNEFIDEAFDSIELATNFKNQLVSSSVTEDRLFDCIRVGYFARVMNFVDTFVSEEKTNANLKERLFDSFKSSLIAGTMRYMEINHLQKILVWFLGSDDEVDKFKKSIFIDDTFSNMIRYEKSFLPEDSIEYFTKFDKFLLWYFTNLEEVDEFKKRFFEE